MDESIERLYSIGGTKLDDSGAPVKTFPRGRQCREQECVTRLSIYNDSNYRAQHHRRVAPRMRGKKVA